MAGEGTAGYVTRNNVAENVCYVCGCYKHHDRRVKSPRGQSRLPPPLRRSPATFFKQQPLSARAPNKIDVPQRGDHRQRLVMAHSASPRSHSANPAKMPFSTVAPDNATLPAAAQSSPKVNRQAPFSRKNDHKAYSPARRFRESYAGPVHQRISRQ